MFNSFPDCMKALMENPRLDEANGGQVVKVEGRFEYYLHGALELEGEPFVKVIRSYVPGETWTASFLNWPEAEQGYQGFNREFPIIVVSLTTPFSADFALRVRFCICMSSLRARFAR